MTKDKEVKAESAGEMLHDLTPIEKLRVAAVKVRPKQFDFSTGFGEKWECVHPRDADDDTAESCCPIMDYIYPLPCYDGEPGEDQAMLIEASACVLVSIQEEMYLALAGGGMDLSWDICHAYMLLGYLPPVHFCELPEFSGVKLDEQTKWIIDACIKSETIMSNWSQSRVERLHAYKKNLEDERLLKRYLATASIIETYTTYVEARDDEEALEICMKLPLDELEPDDSTGEWDVEEMEDLGSPEEET